MRSLKISFAAIVLLSLSACGGGGGGDSGSDGNGGSGGGGGGAGKAPAIPMVSGEFKSSQITGQKFPEGIHTFSQCDFGNAYDRYFESEQVLVYASSNAAIDSDYQYIASSVQNQFADVLGKMNLDLQQFKSLRSAFTPNAVSEIVSLEDRMTSSIPQSEALRTHPDYASASDSLKMLMRRGAFFALSRQQQIELADAYTPVLNVSLADMRMPEKLVVCIDTNRSAQAEFGEGSLAGMEIAALSKLSRSDVNQIVYHELVHTIQGNIAAPYGDLNSIDRWFLEGQAVNIAGQKIASKTDGLNPTNVIAFTQEPFGETSKYYQHYGLAYSFLAKHNSPADFHNLFMDLRYSIAPEEPEVGIVEPKFIEGFENNMKVNGIPLTLMDFKNNYLELVK